MGLYGGDTNASRGLDRLGEKSVVFDRVIAPSSWTKPSTAAMLTGVYPRSLGLFVEQEEILPDSAITLAEALQEAGYYTIGVTANPMLNTAFNFHQGFDEYINSNVIYGWMEGDESSRYMENPMATARDVFGTAKSSIEAHDGDEPLYVQLNIMEMHEFSRKEHRITRSEYESMFRRSPKARYLQALRQVSDDVMDFIEELESSPEWRNTLFIFTSDHGEGLDSHPDVNRAYSHGRVLYESNVVVPLFLYHSGGKLEPKRIAQAVRLLDLAPTVAEYAGVKLADSIDGRSMMPLVRGDADSIELPEKFVAETYFRGVNKRGVYGGGWNYYVNFDRITVRLHEELQQAKAPENGAVTDRRSDHPDVVDEMAAYLDAWEAKYEKAAPALQTEALSDEIREQLTNIGYLN